MHPTLHFAVASSLTKSSTHSTTSAANKHLHETAPSANRGLNLHIYLPMYLKKSNYIERYVNYKLPKTKLPAEHLNTDLKFHFLFLPSIISIWTYS